MGSTQYSGEASCTSRSLTCPFSFGSSSAPSVPDVVSGVASDGGINLIPNHCWYRGKRFDCGLSIGCAVSGRKTMDLCNGGLVWMCCVDRDAVNRCAF